MNTDFDELLRDGMDRFTAELGAPANLAARARRSRRQRLTLRTAFSGLAAAAAAVTVFATLPHATTPTAVSGHAQVPERFDIEHARLTQMGYGSYQLWSYGKQLRELVSSAPGRPVLDEGVAPVKGKSGHQRLVTTIVSYKHKTWARGRLNFAPTAVSFNCDPLELQSVPVKASTLPTWIRNLHKMIKCGALKPSGHQRISGIRTIVLKSGNRLENGQHSMTFWVKQSDYVPVRAIEKTGHELTRIDLSWLRPDQANLALLRVRVPHGFRKVPISKQADAGSVSGSGHSSGCHVSSSHPHKQVCGSSG